MSAGDPALLLRELWMERLRRQVYESVARQELLSHTLSCLTTMVERQLPDLFSCIVYPTDRAGDRTAAFEMVPGSAGDAMAAECAAFWHRHGGNPPSAELYERLEVTPAWVSATGAAGGTPAALWSVPISGQRPTDPVAGSMVMLLRNGRAPGEADHAVASLAAELAGFAIGAARLAEQANRQLMQDSLTGLPNATLLRDRLEQASEAARRQNACIALLMVDTDGLRAVNESLGRSAGDELIRKIADRLVTGLRRSDTIARIGAGRFAVVANVRESGRDAAALANKIVSLVASPVKICGREVSVWANVGVSLFPADSQNPADLQQAAEVALHRSKACGRNAIQFFLQHGESSGLAAMEMETRFRRCVEFALMAQALGGEPHADPGGGKLELHYQPQVDHGGRIVGVEALARWTDPILGRVPPDRFIAAAERNGVIVPFGRWALNEAAAQARRWIDRFGARAPRVAVNVSAVQFATERFVEDVATVLGTYGLQPHMLELELTETVLMHDADEAAQRIGRLRAMGVAVAIDDFGTGYSSLAYLHRLTIDTLKVDRSFVAGMAGERRAPNAVAAGPLQAGGAAVTRAIISMGCSLGMNVLAEGVENDAQRHLLMRMGCNQMQGYLFSPPVPAEKMDALLSADVLPVEQVAARTA